MRTIKILTTILMISFIAWGQSKVGSTAMPFLTIGVGPKAIGMGGAFTATANDVTGIFWNPAGVSRMESSQAMFTHSKWFADINFNWAGAAVNLGNMGTIGASFMYLDYGKMEVTNMREQEGTGEFFEAKDLAIALHYSYNLTDRFSVGGNVKYVRQSIWHSSASTVAFDLGILFISEIDGLRIGATISNFGPDAKMDGKDLLFQHDADGQQYGNNDQVLGYWKTDEFPLPFTFKVGLAYDPIKLEDHKLTIAADVNYPNDNSSSVNVGAEYTFMNLLSIRAGYKSLFLDNADESFTYGVGLIQEVGRNSYLTFDYSFTKMNKLDNTHQFSVGIRF